MSGRVHVVGAGLAGLAAAVRLVERGRAVVVHEAGPAAGGRCRSYFDRELGCRIDNGNHLLLSGNRAAMAFLDQVGSRGTLAGPARAVFPFVDVGTGARWVLRPDAGRVPTWIFRPSRRVPGTRARDYLSMLSLLRAGPARTVAEVVPAGALYDRLLAPLAISALNTMPEAGSAALLGAVMRETLAAGGAACVPCYPREGLSETFIDPAVRWLEARGAEIRTSSRVGSLERDGGRVVCVGGERLGAADGVVLAVPAPGAAGLVPGVSGPDAFEAIVNVHFRFAADLGEAGFVGMVGGMAEWAFAKPEVLSVTISAANRYAALEPVAIAQQVWQELGAVLQLREPMPAWRVLREKRATFAATPSQDRKRPRAATSIANLVLAGDWTATGLPATIEGAIRSGRQAADTLLAE